MTTSNAQENSQKNNYAATSQREHKYESAYEEGTGNLEILQLPHGEQELFELLTLVFDHWSEINFGILIQGSVLEIAPPGRPTSMKLLDGYLTVTFGEQMHFHLCIGDNFGSKKFPTSEKLRKHRKASRAELYRILNPDLEPVSWGLRFFNGENQQMLTIFLPNPFLTSQNRHAKIPDWNKLNLWQKIRAQFLHELEKDPRDFLAKHFVHCC